MAESQDIPPSGARIRSDAPAENNRFVPPFLGIKANQIEKWVNHNIPARSRLSVLLRTLVHSAGHALIKVDFPGNDDAEIPGWDGYVEACEATAWVPAGRSGWEFGTNGDIKKKADRDYKKSVKAIEQKAREETTFVFVTPRRWAGKAKWVKAAQAKGHWKDVRVYDAIDLEQWLEQSIPGQVWFANEADIPAQHVRSLDRCWREWAGVSTPPLTGTLFSPAIEASKRLLRSRLSNQPDGPTFICADSTGEALAYLAQLFGDLGGEELTAYRDHVLIFDKTGVLPNLAKGSSAFIPVVFTRDVERELAPHANSMHSIVVYPRNAANIKPHFALEPIDSETFNRALSEIGMQRDDISRLENESGRSLTVLRRRVAAVQTIEWADDHEVKESLFPFVFVGAWDSANTADKRGLSLLAGDRPYTDLDRDFQRLGQLNDTPVWSIATYRGIVSKIDLLFTIAGIITPADLDRYFSMALMVLGEDDPSLDLEEDKRWLASIYGKTREFSGAFRKGISETLVLLAVFGNSLFKERLGVDTAVQALRVVRDLLPTPLTTRRLEANDRDLPTYAEAAPDEFLSILERDLKTEAPAVFGLLRPVSSGVFSHSSRSGLLWALEGLSWNPETLPRAALILARLAQVEIDDNWSNKPMNSLKSIFRARMPQTAANHEVRVGLMKTLADRFPDIAWEICVAQFSRYSSHGSYSHKPRWRSDGYGFGEPFKTLGPVQNFQREMVELALGWKEQTLRTLGDLVERLQVLDPSYQIRIWMLIETWAVEKASDSDKAAIREKIRVSTLMRHMVKRSKQNKQLANLISKAKEVYVALEPSDLLDKHAWLFRDSWVEESADEIEDDNFDYQKHAERVQKLRIDALREIYDSRGYTGLLEMAERGNAARAIGWCAASDLLSEVELKEFVLLALQSVLRNSDGISPFKSLISSTLHALSEEGQRERFIKVIEMDLPEGDIVHVLLLAPFRKSTWGMVDALSGAAQAKYWAEVVPDWIHDSDEEGNEGVARLLKAGRPRAAFSCIRLKPETLDTQSMFHLLSEVAMSGSDLPGEYLLNNHDVVRAFEHMGKSLDLTIEQKAGLEFLYIEALASLCGEGARASRIPNLERYVELHPEIFVHAVVWTYMRQDNGDDPIEFQVAPDRHKELSGNYKRLLESIRRIPWHDDNGELRSDRLASWIAIVRQSCFALSRIEIADDCIGKLLSHAPVGKDGVWPCEPVRDVMEEIQSENMLDGARVELYNSVGLQLRGEGGNQERVLADKYRKWGQALQFSHPFVSSRLLMRLVKMYEGEAIREDHEAMVKRRLR